MSRYSVIFCPFYERAKNGYCSCKCRRHQLGLPCEQFHRPGWVEQMSLSSSNCRFPRPCFVAAIIFPTQNGCQKITDYRDTAALSGNLTFSSFLSFSPWKIHSLTNLCLKVPKYLLVEGRWSVLLYFFLFFSQHSKENKQVDFCLGAKKKVKRRGGIAGDGRLI